VARRDDSRHHTNVPLTQMGGSTMRFVDDEYLLLSRTGRPSQRLDSRALRESERRARQLEEVRLARARKPPEPLVLRLPLPLPIHLVPRGRE
jgi:hypothetical protein